MTHPGHCLAMSEALINMTKRKLKETTWCLHDKPANKQQRSLLWAQGHRVTAYDRTKMHNIKRKTK